MRLRLLAASAIVLSAAAVPALAQTDWSGPYFGAAVGYAQHDGDDSETIQFDKDLNGAFGDTVTTTAGANAFSPGFCSGRTAGAVPSAGCSERDGGLDFNVRAGYDWQFGSWVLGGVAEFGTADVQDSVGAFSTTPAGYSMTRDLNHVLAGRVRGGYAFGDYLPYVTGGAVRARVNHSFSTTNTANTFVQSDDNYANGYQLGAGVEKAFSTGVRVGVEYMFTRIDDDSFRVRAQGPVPATNPFILTNAAGTDFRRGSSDFDVQSVRATVSYAF